MLFIISNIISMIKKELLNISELETKLVYGVLRFYILKSTHI